MTRFQSICLKIAGTLCSLIGLLVISLYLNEAEAAMLIGIVGIAKIIHCIWKVGR